MQQTTYPLVPVICENEEFAAAYNADVMSSLYQSRCMRTGEVERLIEQGAKFDQLVFINDQNPKLVDKLNFDGQWSKDLMPEIVKLDVDETQKNAIGDVHRAIQNVIYSRGTG